MRSIGPTGDASVPSKSLSRLRRFVRFAMLALCLMTVLIGAGFLWFVRLMPTSEIVLARNADGIVVLTGAALRISDALDLLAAGRGRRLLISGVNPTVSRADLAKMWPGDPALFECCVDLGHEAQTTVGNASELDAWTREHGYSSLILVTSEFHMPRALLEARERMIDVEIIPYAVASDHLGPDGRPRRLADWQHIGGEYTKYLAARVKAVVS